MTETKILEPKVESETVLAQRQGLGLVNETIANLFSHSFVKQEFILPTDLNHPIDQPTTVYFLRKPSLPVIEGETQYDSTSQNTHFLLTEYGVVIIGMQNDSGKYTESGEMEPVSDNLKQLGKTEIISAESLNHIILQIRDHFDQNEFGKAESHNHWLTKQVKIIHNSIDSDDQLTDLAYIMPAHFDPKDSLGSQIYHTVVDYARGTEQELQDDYSKRSSKEHVSMIASPTSILSRAFESLDDNIVTDTNRTNPNWQNSGGIWKR